MTSFKISSKRKLPEGVKASKTSKKVPHSEREYFPLTKLSVGDSFFADSYTARDLRGVIHSKERTRGMKFVSRTISTSRQYGAIVWRVK